VKTMGKHTRGSFVLINIVLTCFLGLCFTSCPFQVPFGFLDDPLIQPVLDEFGNTMADQVWIEFGRIQNLKCIDYFRVTYEKTDKTGVTTITTDPINRHEKGAQMTVVPCTLYKFKVAAYEEFHGTGKRFKMMSNEVSFTLDYTPKFIKQPIVWEKKASPLSNVRHRQLPREKRGIFRRTTTTQRTTTEPFLTIQTVWDLTYIDFPICLDRVEFEYLNLEWQEALYTEVFDDPQNRMSFVVSNKQLPCNDEFVFVVKAYGVNGDHTNTTWYPPSCVSTTPEPTTEGSTPPEFERCHAGASFVFLHLFCY